ncbi:MAG: cyanoexosortase A system-associated protein [Pseudanabaena frigida]|uniref:Cyanoexosortase A system-associated protein n=1 Tax=Pseudanabaena frigida TaxID=945775 RepID=A0A2W4W853_9CYAN|nr:MAG: cyanoexosortase A system-associated protein [Pseudanabaena frigida]
MENEADKLDSNDNKLKNINPQNSQSHKLRFGLLAILIGSSLLILGRSLVDISLGKPTPFIFPSQIELAQTSTKPSEATELEDLVDTNDFFGKPKYLSGKSYKYLLDDMSVVEIYIRYAVGTEGDIFLLLKGLTNIEISEDELYQKTARKDAIGYYAIFNYQNRAYLTACINPRGISTVTKEQFDDNASDRAMDRDVVIAWLLGQKDLRDRRCLWTLMSTPLRSESDRDATDRKLEKIWISWYEWWQPRFPSP